MPPPDRARCIPITRCRCRGRLTSTTLRERSTAAAQPSGSKQDRATCACTDVQGLAFGSVKHAKPQCFCSSGEALYFSRGGLALFFVFNALLPQQLPFSHLRRADP